MERRFRNRAAQDRSRYLRRGFVVILRRSVRFALRRFDGIHVGKFQTCSFPGTNRN